MAAANPELRMSQQNADKLYAEFPRHLRGSLHDAVIKSDTSPFRDKPDESGAGKSFALKVGNYPASVDMPSVIVGGLGLDEDQQRKLLDLMSAKMNALNPPAAGGRRRKSTTRVRVRGRPSTRRTRRATYGARRRATSARAVRARRPSK